MSGIEQAAQAFDTELGNAPTESREVEQMPMAGLEDKIDEELEEVDEELDEAEEEPDEGEEGEEEGEDEGEKKDAEEPKETVKTDLGDLPAEAKVTVVVDGKAQEVSLKEAVDGYIRQETFHQRLNQVRDVATEVQTMAQQVAQNRDLYLTGLNALSEQLEGLTPKEPDWAAEFQRDPQRAGELRLQWDTFKQQRAAIDQERQRVYAEQQQAQQAQLAQLVQEGQKQMLADHPEWNDQAKFSEARQLMADFAVRSGYTLDDLNSIFDPRQIRILYKAAQFDALERNKPKPDARIDNRTPAQKKAAPRRPNRPARNSAEQLGRTGRVRDAAAFFKDILDNEG